MKLVFRSELFNLTLWLCHIISLLWSMLSMCSFSSITGVIRNNRVREMAFGLFLPSVLSVFTSSHFQEEELPEKWFWVNPAQCFFRVKLKSDIKVSGNCFSSPPSQMQGQWYEAERNHSSIICLPLNFSYKFKVRLWPGNQ